MIYFDYAATSKPLEEAETCFKEVNENYFGNPSSPHYFGQEALRILEDSRSEMLSLLGLAKTHFCIFNSGATESDNLAIKGVAFSYQNRGKRIITDAVEHPAVLHAFQQLKDFFGFDVVILPVTNKGTVDPEVLRQAMDNNTTLVSIMSVNNETGSMNDIEELAKVVHSFPKAFFHVDATQSIGKEKLNYGVADLISFSGHKFGAFKGTGALIARKNVKLLSLNSGGLQEYGFRGGTDNVAGDAAMATALKFMNDHYDEFHDRVLTIRNRLFELLRSRDDVILHSDESCSPFVSSFSLKKKKASVVVEALSRKEIYVSSVSACSSSKEILSHVLLAMGCSEEEAGNSIRISFSGLNTLEELETFYKEFSSIMKELKDR